MAQTVRLCARARSILLSILRSKLVRLIARTSKCVIVASTVLDRKVWQNYAALAALLCFNLVPIFPR